MMGFGAIKCIPKSSIMAHLYPSYRAAPQHNQNQRISIVDTWENRYDSKVTTYPKKIYRRDAKGAKTSHSLCGFSLRTLRLCGEYWF